jgi:hydroxycarboxylate dehydrogenase B
LPDSVVVTAANLHAAICAIVCRAGSSEVEARLVADQLVEANLAGHDSHGVGIIPRYAASLQSGSLRPNQHVSLVHDAGPVLTLDGNQGYGQAIGFEAMELGIARARAHGTAIVGLANAHHLGRIGHWAEQCSRAGLVSVHFVSVRARPIVAPWGGRDARLGTNPFCVGVPRRDEDPLILDFATSRVAQGKTRVAYNRGEPMPPGTLIDDRGDPTTDPRYSVVQPYGAILPLGEHKGYGLALLCEILGGALTGGETMHDGEERPYILNGMLTILIDPERMATAGNLAAEATALVDFVTASPPADGVDRIRIPGEPERESRRARMASGIPIDPATWAEVLDAAEQLGLPRAEVVTLAGL